jgi:hypothetical protein
MFDMANDSGLFNTADKLHHDGWVLEGNTFTDGEQRMLPLYEAKMIHFFDHRYGTYQGQTKAQSNMGTLPRLPESEKRDPMKAVMPRYWVDENKDEVAKKLSNRSDHRWLLGWRDVARSTDERTLICGPLPSVAVGHKAPLVFSAEPLVPLLANLSSFVLDYVVRQKYAGTSLAYFVIKQLPALPPRHYRDASPWDSGRSLVDWVTVRVLELSYTAWDMKPFAGDQGDDGAPFVWDELRRFGIRAELDAAYFHLYGVEREDVGYVLDSFRAFRNNDPERFARTREAILGRYDAMAEAMTSGEAYRTPLDPPPGQGPRHPDRDG